MDADRLVREIWDYLRAQRADAARLDWLEARMKGGVGAWECGAGNIRLECSGPAQEKGPRANGDTLRAAIDAAMESERKA